MKLRSILALSVILLINITIHAQALTASRANAYNEPVKNTAPELPLSFDKGCADNNAMLVIIDEAITAGAPTYNGGNHLGCFRIYEGAAYKVLYKYGSKCKDVKGVLEAALEKAYGDYTSTEKAWIMRTAFDYILGVPTKTTK